MIGAPVVYQQGVGAATADGLNTAVQTCTSAAQLRTVAGLTGMQVLLLGISLPNDGGQGAFYWNSAATAPDDNLNVIRPNGLFTGAWLRINTSSDVEFDTVAQLAASAIFPAGVTSAYVKGYYSPGDGGGGLYLASTPGAGPGKVMSASGSWWILAPGIFSTRQFGAKLDGATDDTAAINNAVALAVIYGTLNVFSPAGTSIITAPIAITAPAFTFTGWGMGVSVIKASDSFTAMFTFATSVLQLYFADITLDQTGTTTQCVNFAIQSGALLPTDFAFVQFKGDMNATPGVLVYCGGIAVQFFRCVWSPDNIHLTCIQMDQSAINNSLLGCLLIGPGNGVSLTRSTGAGLGPQGVRIQDTTFATFGGAFGISIGGVSANTYIGNSVVDQAGTNAILINGGASEVQIVGGWAGLIGGSTGNAIEMDWTVSAISIVGVQIFGGITNILTLGTTGPSNRIDGLQILNNQLFADATTEAAMQLDSVANCVITGNSDYGFSTNPSLKTFGTNALKGQYIIGTNVFTPTTPTLDAASSYKPAGECLGWTLVRSFVASSPSGTAVTVAHGLNCGLAPTVVQATPQGATPQSVSVSAIGAANLTINYSNSGAANFSVTASLVQ